MRTVVLCLALGWLGCGSPSPPARAAVAPLEHTILVTGGAGHDETLPLIVALHGRGDRPERFARIFEGFRGRARIALLRAPIEEGDGLAWFTFPDVDTWAHVAREVSASGERTVATVEALEQRHPTRGAPVVTGFSQGAMIVYALALQHPGRFALFAPVSGVLVRGTIPPGRPTPTPRPRIVAFHGTRDPIIPITAGRESVEELGTMGVSVELREHDAVHWIDGELQRDLHAVIASALAPE